MVLPAKKNSILGISVEMRTLIKIPLIIIIGASAFFVYAELFTPGAGLWTGIPPSDYVLSSSTEPDGGGYGAGVYLDVVSVDAVQSILTVDTMYYGTVGIGHVWYEVNEDAVFDADYVAANTPFFDMSDYTSIGQIIMTHNESFLIGFCLGGGEDCVYGWAELMYDGSTLVLIDSAAENDGVGIITGQYQQVPEPATVLLFGLGGLGAWLYRRKKRNSLFRRF